MSAQEQKVQGHEQPEGQNLSQVPVDNQFIGAFFSSLPVAPDGCSCGTRIGSQQVARPNCAGEVSALGQMLPLLSTGKDAGVSTWCGCRPAGDLLAAIQVQGQRPPCVDSCDPVHWDREASSNIFNNYCAFVHLNFGKPKEHQGYLRHQRNCWQRQKHTFSTVGGKNTDQSQDQRDYDNNRKSSGGFGYESAHRISVAVNGRVFA